MSGQELRLLIVDDEESVRVPLAEHLKAIYHYAVDATADGQQALGLLKKFQGLYDVALIDQVLEGNINGLDLLAKIKKQYPDIQVIMFTGWEMNEDESVEILRQGAYRYFAKPYNLKELALTIRFAAEERWARLERRYMAALVMANQSLTQKKKQEEQLLIAWDFVRDQLDVSTFFVALCSPNSEYLSFPIAFDKGLAVALPNVNLMDEQSELSLAGYVVKKGEEVLWSTLNEEEIICKGRNITLRLEGKSSASSFCIPLQIGERIIGVLSAQSYQQHIFTPVLQNTLRALSGNLSAALENSHLISDLEQKRLDVELQSNRLSALHELAITINSTLDLREILTKTCEAAVDFFDADHSGLVLFDPDFERGKVVAEYPDFGALDLSIRLRGISAQEKLIETYQPLFIYDVYTEHVLGEIKNYLSELGIKSILYVPVIGKAGIIGSFSLDAIKQQRRFSEEDIELSKAFAAQVAIAIENARLFYAVQEGQDYLQSLFRASSEVISPRDPIEVLQSIVEQACQSTTASQAVILLVDESGNPRVLASSGFDHQLEATTSIRKSGLSREVLSSGISRFIEDISKEADVVHPAMMKQGVKAAACLPLQLMGKNIGILWIHFQEKHNFSASERTALQIYANQSAVAYDNAHHMRELEQLHQATEAISSVEEPKQVLQKIVEGATQVLGADFALIWSYDVNRDIFIPEELAAFGLTDERLEKFKEEEPKAGKTTRRVLKEGYVEVTELATEPSEHLGEPTRNFLRELNVKSFQSILLSVADEPLGVLHLDYKTPRHFDSGERRVLENFANHAALTLKKARLITQVNRAREAAQVVAKVSTLGKVEKTLDEIVHGAKDVLKCDITTLYTFDEHLQNFKLVTGTGYKGNDSLRSPSEIAKNSSLWRVIQLDSPYYHFAENAPEDRLLQGGFVKNEKVRSSLAVQLHFGTERVGVMFVSYRTPHRFTEEEINNALQFADQAAVAIWNAQLHQEVQRRVEALNALYEAGKAISSTLPLDETLARIATQALYVIGSISQSKGCFSYITLRNGNTLQFVTTSSSEIHQKLLQHGEINLDQNGKIGIVGQVIRTGYSANIGDVTKNTDYICISDKTISHLSVPIKRGEIVMGVLSIEHPEINAFVDDDVRNLELLAAQAGVAIENTRLFEASEKVTSSLDQDVTFAAICRIAVDYFNVDHSGLVLFDDDLKNGRVVAEYPRMGTEGVLIPLLGVPAEEKLIESREPLIITDVPGEAGFEPVRDILNKLGSRSILVIPIIGKNGILGSFGLDVMKQPRTFTKDEIEVCKLFAMQAAVAIENAQTHKETEKLLLDRTLTMHEAQQRAAAAERLALMGNVGNEFAHRMNNLAGTIPVRIKLAKEGLNQKNLRDAKVIHQLDMIYEGSMQLLKAAQEIKQSTEIRPAENVPINEILEFAVERALTMRPGIEDRIKVVKHFENDLPNVFVQRNKLVDTFASVIINGLESISRRGTLTLATKQETIDGGQWILIAISDTGKGIPADVLPKIFELFYTSKGSKGLGFGLWRDKAFIKGIGGDIEVQSELSKGSIFTIKIPINIEISKPIRRTSHGKK